MNLQKLLIANHQALRLDIEVLQTQIEKADPHLAESLTSFQSAVQKHFRREEPFYKVLDDGKRVPDRGLMHQLRNDHAAVVFSLESLAIRLRKNGLNADWTARWETLLGVFLPHLETEETKLFPLASSLLSQSQQEALAKEIENHE